MSDGRFAGRVALVTGASRGLGREIAGRLADEGATVGMLARDGAALAAVAAEVERDGGRALALPCDVADDDAVRAAVDALTEAAGGLDLAVHAAGALKLGTAPETTVHSWDTLMEVNAKGAFLLARHAVPALRARGGGAVVNVASIYAVAAEPGAAAYAASKAAVIALTRTMALDHAREGIRFNCVSPGPMRTPMVERVIAAAHAPGPDTEAAYAAIAARNPIGRMVEVGEVAELVLFLLGDESRAITGTCQTIDGGRLAQLT